MVRVSRAASHCHILRALTYGDGPEILARILSHLHSDTHLAVALVSKRFYDLMITPYVWQLAFIRYFAGHQALSGRRDARAAQKSTARPPRSDVRYFTRLTPMASWRTDYLMRTRLLRGVSQGKPGTTGDAPRSGHSGRKASAVLTYNSELPCPITNLHAVFNSSKRGPKAVHGASSLCLATLGDPTVGKLDRWGSTDDFFSPTLSDVLPDPTPYGLGSEPAAVPNVMDVSALYGAVGGQGYPGGRAWLRTVSDKRGRYLDSGLPGSGSRIPGVPRINEMHEAVCTVWIAKTAAVLATTGCMAGVMTGSSLGIVTAYALGYDTSTPAHGYANGELTARWMLSPGVPIIALAVDNSYNAKRRSSGRIWAAALNALGELFYLADVPTPAPRSERQEDRGGAAWRAGRTAPWRMVQGTRRTPCAGLSPDEAAVAARSAMASSYGVDETPAAIQRMEELLGRKPEHFRKHFQSWDMRRKLEVDFGGGADHETLEGLFVIACGYDEEQPASVTRYTRCLVAPTPTAPTSEEWRKSSFALRAHTHASVRITSSACDMSHCALFCPFEDPLVTSPGLDGETSNNEQPSAQIPGRRARLVAVGTNAGAVIIWNMRDASAGEVQPLRVLQTDSPEVSSLALSSLYAVHGGTDGVVQVWDPLASMLGPIRTLNSRASARAPRPLTRFDPGLRAPESTAAGAIYLDPDPAVLRGVVSFGSYVRYWSYAPTVEVTSRKRRHRHSNVHGRRTNRRHGGGTVLEYIAAEHAALRRELEHRRSEHARLRKRFGVGLGSLTEEEAIAYAQMMSQDSFFLEEQRRASPSDTASTSDNTDATSSAGSASTESVTAAAADAPHGSEAAPSSPSLGLLPVGDDTSDDDENYQRELRRALRLSLLEGVNDAGQSPRDNGAGEYGFQIKFKPKKEKSGRRSASSSPSLTQSPTPVAGRSTARHAAARPGADPDEDLALALSLSLEEEQARQAHVAAAGLGIQDQDFPALGSSSKGKGRWT